jgi:hypothetical protein
MWLLDPYDVTISTAATAGGTPSPVIAGSTWVPNAAGSNILNTQINTALNTGSVTVTTTSSVGTETGDITVLGAISSVGSAGGSLILLADGGITLNSSISIGVANLTLNATGGDIETNANITTTSGDVTITSSGKIDVNGNITTSLASANVVLNASGGDITLNGAITTAVSRVTLNANGNNIVLNNGITSNGNVGLNGEAITLNGGIDVSGATGASVGGVTIDANGAVSGSAAISLAQFYNPTTGLADAIDGGLVIRSGGSVQAFIETPVSFDTSSGSAVWNPLLAGPPIAVNAAGDVSLVNQAPVGSTLTVGSFGGTGGITSTGSVTLSAGAGNLILGRNSVSGTTFIGRSTEATSGIIFAAASSRLGPAVDTTGAQVYNGVVTLNTYIQGSTVPGLTVLSGVGIDFRNTINDGSINTTASGLVADDPVAVTKHILPTGSEELILLNTGTTNFQDLVGTALVPGTPLVNDPYLSLGPLASFTQEGGTVEFLATGTAFQPQTDPAGDPTGLALNGQTVGPSIYTTGFLNFGGAGTAVDILLSANTYLSAYKDIYFGGTVDTTTGGGSPYTLTVTTIDGSATPGTTIGGGQIIFDGAIGSTGALGALTVTAAGTDGNGKGAQININAGAITFTGTNPIPDGANGAITLTADGAVVLAGTIETNSSETIGGGLSVISDNSGYSSVTDNKNIQIGATINTRGGAIDFLSPVFFTGASTLDTTVGNSGGAITFNDTTDGAAQATMNSGTAVISFLGNLGSQSNFNLAILGAGGVTFGGTALLGAGENTINSLAGNVLFDSTLDIRNAGTLTMNLGNNSVDFTDAVGGTNPFGMTVTSAGGVTFSQAVNMGGNFVFSNLSGAFLASEAINSIAVASGLTGYALTINPVNTGATVELSAVGTTSALGAVTVSSGGGATTLNGNIFTAGGAVNLGGPVTLDTEAITINTTELGNSNGNNILFLGSLSGAEDLSLNAGITGNIRFGQGSTGLSSLTVTEAGGGFSMSQVVSVAGLIDINAAINPVSNGEAISFTSTGGNILLRQGILGQSNSTQGSDVTLNALVGTVTVAGNISLNGSALVANSPGFRGGNMVVTAREVSVQDISTLGGGDNEELSPGAAEGGSVTLTATAGDITTGGITTQGGLQGTRGSGGRGGNVTLDALGTITTGNLNLSGGETTEGVGGSAGSLNLIAGDRTILIGGVIVSGGNGGGGGTGGTAGSITFGDLEIGVSSVLIRAVGGENGADTVVGTGTVGRGADGQLTFNGTVDGESALVNSLVIDVGAGSATFNNALGSTIELGQLTISNARDVTFSALAELNAGYFVQNGSVPSGGIYTNDNQAGTTTFNGAVTLSGAGLALDLTGYNFNLNGPVSLANGSVQASFAGVFALNDALTLGGDLTLVDENIPNLVPRADIGANITTSSGSLKFGDANPLNVRLTANTVTLSTGVSGGEITFDGLLDSDGGFRSLVLINGGTTTFNDLIGSQSPLQNLTTSATGSTVFAATGARSTPSINLTGTASFQNQIQLESETVIQANALTLAGTGFIDGANDLLVLLSAGAFTLNGQVGRDTALTSFRVEGGSGVNFDFVGTQANLSVVTTGNQYYQTAVTLGQNTILNAGSMDFLSTVNGGSSLLLDSAGAINLYGLVGNTGTALTQFQTSGGGILNLLATGASGANPTIKTTGAQLFGSSLVLGEDTFLTSTTSGDFIFLNAIDSRQANQPRNLTVQGAERVVLESAAGGAVRLGGVSLTAGTDVTVLGGIDTFGALIDITAGNGVTSGSVVLSGDITTAVADQLGGAINLSADEEVIFNGGAVNTFGGNVTVTGPAFIQAATTLTTAGGDVNDGTVDFRGALNGDSILTLNAGTAAVTFTGAVGGNQPLDLNIQGAGGVTFSQSVLLGTAASTINSTAGNVTFDSTLDKLAGTLTMALGTRTASFGAVGSSNPFAMTVSSAGGLTFSGAVRMGGAFNLNVDGPAPVVSFTQTDTASDWRLGVGDGGLSLLNSSQIAPCTPISPSCTNAG